MADLVCFKLENNIYYCPIQLNNNIFTTNAGERNDTDVCEDVLWNLVCSAKQDLYYIMDFSECIGSIENTSEIIKRLAKSRFIIIVREKFKSVFETQGIKEVEIEEVAEKDNKIWIVKSNVEKELNDYMERIKPEIEKYGCTEFFYKIILTQFFYRDIKNNNSYSFKKGSLKYLESSNVYVNKYINVKSLFLDYSYMMLVVKGLKRMIKKNFLYDGKEISLLGVSNNGIILANLLSYELNLQVQSLSRLGPVYCLEDSVDRLNNFSEKNYVLVSDVICMGGELRMAKGIVNILGAHLLGGICVVKIREVYRGNKEEKVYALLNDINGLEVDNDRIGYQIFIDDEETEEE